MLNWPLLTAVHLSTTTVWNFASELVKSAVFILCYKHEAVLHGMLSLLGDCRMSLQEQQLLGFYNSFLSTTLVWGYSLISLTVLRIPPCVPILHMGQREGERRQMCFIYTVDLKHIVKSQCFTWESLVYKECGFVSQLEHEKQRCLVEFYMSPPASYLVPRCCFRSVPVP